jgi:hypothetical protein
MLFNITYHEMVLGRKFFFVIYLKKFLSIITLSPIILERVKASTNNPNIFVDLYIPGITITMAASRS